MTSAPTSAAIRAPASLAQRRLWFDSALRREHGDAAAYHAALLLRSTDPVDPAVLARALTAVVARHEVLRTTYDVADGEVYQRIAPAGPVEVAVRDVPDGGSAADALATAVDATVRAAPIDLRDGPAVRAVLFPAGPAVLVVVHHIATDGLSMRLLADELAEHYAAARDGRPARVPHLPVQYRDHAGRQHDERAAGGLAAGLAFWRDHLDGAPRVLELPLDRPRPTHRTYAVGTVTAEVPADLVHRLRRLAGIEGTDLTALLLAAYHLLLARWSGQRDLIVGLPVANRTRPGTAALIGFFVNLLPVRLRIDERRTFRDLLRYARDTTTDALAYQQVSFDLLVELTAPERTLAHHPLVQAVLSVTEDDAPARPALGEIALVRYGGENDFDLTLDVVTRGDAMSVHAHHATDVFDAATVAALLARFTALLHDVTARPDQPLTAQDPLAPAERSHVLRVLAQGPVRPVGPLLDRLRRTGRDRPDDLAVTSVDGDLTFRELHERSDRLAAELAARGIGPDRVVGVCLPRSAELPVALLAVLKAGGAYLPLDPAQPAGRLRLMLADGGATVLLTDTGAADPWWSPDVSAIDVSDPHAGIAAAPPDVTPHPDHLAYVIFTSGSTGRPKGVGLTHRGLANFTAWYVDAFGLTPDDRASQLVNPGCDASLLDLVPTLAVGARLVVVPDDDRLGGGLWRYFAETGVTISFLVTPALTASAPTAPVRHPSLRRLLVGGERLPTVPRGLPCPLANVYGPTETTIAATHGWLTGGDQTHVGGPMLNARTYVLDDTLRPVPVGAAGELYVGGAGLARGYVGNPRLTAERFPPDPFAGDGSRMYRTGDRVRWTRGGSLEFLGRADDQVKIRGFRVEPGEVATALAEAPGVAAAVVLLVPDLPAGPGLVAFCRPVGPAGSGWLDRVRRYAADTLPAHLVPTLFVPVERFPLNANGKVDRAALTADVARHTGPAGPEWTPPTGPVERRVARVWRDVLGVARVGADDDFFHLGGHSLLVVRVTDRLAAELDRPVPLSLIFRYPTLRAFADQLAR